MANPLFNMMGGTMLPGNMGNLIQKFNDFKRTFQGNPQEQIQQMLNSGKLSQAQYNQAVQMANAFAQMLK